MKIKLLKKNIYSKMWYKFENNFLIFEKDGIFSKF